MSVIIQAFDGMVQNSFSVKLRQDCHVLRQPSSRMQRERGGWPEPVRRPPLAGATSSRGQISIDLRFQSTHDRHGCRRKEICNFLKCHHGQFVSAREIARRAGGKWRFRDDPNWAMPILLRLVEKGFVESDAAGYYRLRPTEEEEG